MRLPVGFRERGDEGIDGVDLFFRIRCDREQVGNLGEHSQSADSHLLLVSHRVPKKESTKDDMNDNDGYRNDAAASEERMHVVFRVILQCQRSMGTRL